MIDTFFKNTHNEDLLSFITIKTTYIIGKPFHREYVIPINIDWEIQRQSNLYYNGILRGSSTSNELEF